MGGKKKETGGKKNGKRSNSKENKVNFGSIVKTKSKLIQVFLIFFKKKFKKG
jgi:hypothetical protein